jgi:hypothetical protein
VQEAEESRLRAAELNSQRRTIRLLGREVPVLPAADGTVRAEDDGKPGSAKSVQSHIARAFGDRLLEVRAAMEALAATLPTEELSRIGFRFYERSQPNAPDGAPDRSSRHPIWAAIDWRYWVYPEVGSPV